MESFIIFLHAAPAIDFFIFLRIPLSVLVLQSLFLFFPLLFFLFPSLIILFLSLFVLFLSLLSLFFRFFYPLRSSQVVLTFFFLLSLSCLFIFLLQLLTHLCCSLRIRLKLRNIMGLTEFSVSFINSVGGKVFVIAYITIQQFQHKSHHFHCLVVE